MTPLFTLTYESCKIRVEFHSFFYILENKNNGFICRLVQLLVSAFLLNKQKKRCERWICNLLLLFQKKYIREILQLRDGDREYYYAALDKHFLGMKQRYIKAYGNAYELPSPRARELMSIFMDTCRNNVILCTPDECFGYYEKF